MHAFWHCPCRWKISASRPMSSQLPNHTRSAINRLESRYAGSVWHYLSASLGQGIQPSEPTTRRYESFIWMEKRNTVLRLVEDVLAAPPKTSSSTYHYTAEGSSPRRDSILMDVVYHGIHHLVMSVGRVSAWRSTLELLYSCAMGNIHYNHFHFFRRQAGELLRLPYGKRWTHN